MIALNTRVPTNYKQTSDKLTAADQAPVHSPYTPSPLRLNTIVTMVSSSLNSQLLKPQLNRRAESNNPWPKDLGNTSFFIFDMDDGFWIQSTEVGKAGRVSAYVLQFHGWTQEHGVPLPF